MTNKRETVYFPDEGRAHMRECISRAAEACVGAGLSKLVIFTGTGEGPHYAAKEILSQPKYANLQVVAVTPPYGRTYKMQPGAADSPLVRSGINPAMRDELTSLGIGVVAAHLPFKAVRVGTDYVSEWARVAEAYGVLGGGFALCVQAILVACDAGLVQSGERAVVASADTAIVALAARTESFLAPSDGLLVEHIICRPMRYTVSKRMHVFLDSMWAGPPDPSLPLLGVEAGHAAPAPALPPPDGGASGGEQSRKTAMKKPRKKG